MAVFANPFSGSGPNRAYVDQLVRRFEQSGFGVELVWQRESHESFWRQSHIERRYRCFIVAGGDGSLAGLVNAVPRPELLKQVPLAVFPMGNENLFAKQFRFTRKADLLVDAVRRYETRRIDLGLAGDKLFTLMVSMGFDADVVHRMAQWRRDTTPGGGLKRVSHLSYLPRIVSTIRNYDYPRITVEIDGRRYEGSHVFVFNLPQYGGHLAISDDASGTDSLLNWIVFEKPGIVSLADYALAVMRTKHLGRPDVPHGKTDLLHIHSSTPVPVQADGDPIGFTPVSISVEPGSLRIIEMGR